MQTLSPGKYVQAKARTWPVYKCMVNKNWKETQTAHVWVMRRHSNSNLTVGVYHVDLLCTGIKDTIFFFNTPEQVFFEQFNAQLLDCVEVNYNLAHNIVYAGHDFALEFDIPPHRDFETTRFILEEDSNAVPLVEIPVGANGIPHLVVEKSGQYAEILTRLQQYAGEGNFYYTVTDYESDLPGHNYEEENTRMLEDIPLGDINIGNVYSIRSDEMLNTRKVEERSVSEQVILHAELLTRLLPDDIKDCELHEEALWNDRWDEVVHGAVDANNINQAHFEEYIELAKLTGNLTASLDRNDEAIMKQFEASMLAQTHYYAQNPLAIQLLYEHGVLLGLNLLIEVAGTYALKLYPQYPVLQCSLALGALLQNQPADRFKSIYAQQHIREAIPGYKQYHTLEIVNFWLIHLLLCLRNNDIHTAVQYYYLLADANSNTWLLLPVLEKYVEVLYAYNVSLSDMAPIKDYL